MMGKLEGEKLSPESLLQESGICWRSTKRLSNVLSQRLISFFVIFENALCITFVLICLFVWA